MRRSPLRRSSLPLRRTALSPGTRKLERREPLRFRPSRDELGFDRWVRAVVMERDGGLCQRCYRLNGGQIEGTDCAHIFPLRMGANRREDKDWRNYPAARLLLSRTCHYAIDVLHAWTWTDIGLDLAAIEAAARAEMAAGWPGRRAA